MANEPKADWEKEARELLHRELMVVCVPGRDAYNVEKLAAALRSAHASGAREAEEKLGRAMVVVEAAIEANGDVYGGHSDPRQHGGKPLRCVDDAKFEGLRRALHAGGWCDEYGRRSDASRVGGKETT